MAEIGFRHAARCSVQIPRRQALRALLTGRAWLQPEQGQLGRHARTGTMGRVSTTSDGSELTLRMLP